MVAQWRSNVVRQIPKAVDASRFDTSIAGLKFGMEDPLGSLPLNLVRLRPRLRRCLVKRVRELRRDPSE
jgi:hypothetical protein